MISFLFADSVMDWMESPVIDSRLHSLPFRPKAVGLSCCRRIQSRRIWAFRPPPLRQNWHLIRSSLNPTACAETQANQNSPIDRCCCRHLHLLAIVASVCHWFPETFSNAYIEAQACKTVAIVDSKVSSNVIIATQKVRYCWEIRGSLHSRPRLTGGE